MFPRTFLSDNDVTFINSNFVGDIQPAAIAANWDIRRTPSNKQVEVVAHAISEPQQAKDRDETFTLTQGESRSISIPQSGLLYVNIRSSKPMHVHRPSAPTIHAWNQVVRVRETSLLALNFQHETIAKSIADAWEYRADEMTMVLSSHVVNNGTLTFDIAPWNFDENTTDSSFSFDVQALGTDEEQEQQSNNVSWEYAEYTSGWEWAFNPIAHQSFARNPLKVCVENKPMISDPDHTLTVQLPTTNNQMFHVVLLPLEEDGKCSRPVKVKTGVKNSFVPMPAARCLFNVQNMFGGIAFNCSTKHKFLTLQFTQRTKFVVSIYSSPHDESGISTSRHYDTTGVMFTC